MEEYLFLDPKLSKSSLAKVDKSKMFFNDAIVFVIGGGNYLEYQNLIDCSSVKFRIIKNNSVFLAKNEISCMVRQSYLLPKDF